MEEEWLRKENFSASEYILEKISNTSLEQLLGQVTQNFQQLLTELVQYLWENRQHLEQVVKQVKLLQENGVKIEKKVAQVESELNVVEKEVVKDLKSTTNSLEEKGRYTDLKIALEALQRKNRILRNSWRLLERLEQSNSLPEEEETENLLRNLVLEIGKAKSIDYDGRILDKAIVEQIEENLKNIVSRTEEKLQWWFLTALSDVEQLEESLLRCLECCKTLKLIGKVESWFAEAFVEPFILERLESVESISDRLPVMKDAVQELLRYPFLENMKRTDSFIYRNFSFINHSILPVVVDLLKSRIVHLENMQDPHRFYILYRGIEEIFAQLQQFEKVMYSQDSIYKTPEYRFFWKPEQFRTYFEAVELQLANELELSLSHGRGIQKTSCKFRCEASEGLKVFLEESWSAKIWIWPITGFLLEWSLLGISRYRKYIENYIDKAKDDSSNLQPKDLLNVLLDLKCLPSWIEHEFQLDVPILPNSNVQEVVQDILQLIRTSVMKCSDKHVQVEEILCNLIVTKCTENLQSLRGILAAYRMTTKPVPKHHSPFVSNILRPLRDVLQLISKEEDLKSPIVDTVCQQVVERYIAMTAEIISSVRKAEDTLKRLNLGRSSSGNNSENVSDLEKIRRQLELDGKKLTEELKQIGFFVSEEHLLSGAT
ncbi:Conserved oligomeric Golgi complex subunit 2 [Galdieria sulphuraria]|uniref:Oligomeric Golgi complex component COG2-like protein n=1 Tax=Galdieria sulphuraria TaxID=130081 RepID=M2X1J7_GALSU|nr:oligomeric Golgi complex component COG2-like protein [Galdieria sulphuraria]EME30235.1 oligomeric Golgi complex component COG2-like protein [Galdieria sulphuraria]GJD08404.1 Conserved oligomeric Golgi complex subunit 2 [Galdieria sulphuraria]|eukprot:XP_005706755.1 oligomeric Golgi complex component COG2-like protein [Galdieria sulphuraria]